MFGRPYFTSTYSYKYDRPSLPTSHLFITYLNPSIFSKSRLD